ncbi:Crp/Fnr family transcriptional regulator [Dechloromonas sp. A34]|uniref:Crp/Fnr family transcriptional regulator n=1 Tax=Dechloromonas sp. A34 TaxID=447588 RepID=UPI002249922A|nr:Crp/Fnr family transcriptional regulator [Dechloromonas sp. A34]
MLSTLRKATSLPDHKTINSGRSSAITSLHLETRQPLQAQPGRAPVVSIDRLSRQNRLLKALPDEVWNRISPHLQLCELPLGSCLIEEAGGLYSQVYFPTNAIVSLLCMMENGASAQAAMVGIEGMVGLSRFMGIETSACSAVVLSAGYAFRLPARVLMHEFERTPAVTRLLLCYTQSLITQVMQSAGCNRLHSIEQQLCRCLLASLDRLPGDDLTITHEHISKMIGVRREGITEAAGKLQRLGMIRYSRGHITVLDRPGLEDHACECYSVIKRETERLLPAASWAN